MKYKIKKELNSFNHMENPVIYRIYKRFLWIFWVSFGAQYFFTKEDAERTLNNLMNNA